VHHFGLFDFRGLLAFLLAQIGYHQAQCMATVSPKPVQRQIHRNQTSISATQVEFTFCNPFLSLGKETLGVERWTLDRGYFIPRPGSNAQAQGHKLSTISRLLAASGTGCTVSFSPSLRNLFTNTAEVEPC
jgi:hypothetical protein